MNHPDDPKAPSLRDVLADAIAAVGGTMKDHTVLAVQHDPFRLGTPAGHRDGSWFGHLVARRGTTDSLHLRGFHYVAVSLELVKPDGTPYRNTDNDWVWLQERAAKCGRWLGYVPFEQVHDQRNDAPVLRIAPMPVSTDLKVGCTVDIPEGENFEPRPSVSGFVGRQPYRIALIGEKSSLQPVLEPIADTYDTDLLIPTGEISDTMMYALATAAIADGRPLVILYVSDCDPAGWQMAISVGRKLQALEVLLGEADWRMHRVALKPDQVRAYGLPSTPLKETEKRADPWQRAFEVAQTEVDALMALQPGLLDQLVTDAVEAFCDTGLDDRVGAARREWLADARQAVDNALVPDDVEAKRAEADELVAELGERIDALNEWWEEAVAEVELPEPVIPEAEWPDGLNDPLADSTWGFVKVTRALKASRAYEGDV